VRGRLLLAAALLTVAGSAHAQVDSLARRPPGRDSLARDTTKRDSLARDTTRRDSTARDTIPVLLPTFAPAG